MEKAAFRRPFFASMFNKTNEWPGLRDVISPPPSGAPAAFFTLPWQAAACWRQCALSVNSPSGQSISIISQRSPESNIRQMLDGSSAVALRQAISSENGQPAGMATRFGLFIK